MAWSKSRQLYLADLERSKGLLCWGHIGGTQKLYSMDGTRTTDLEWSTGLLQRNGGLRSCSPSWGGCIQKIDSVHGHHDSMARCRPALNLKVGEMNYVPGKPAPDWAKDSKNGQKRSRSGQENIHTEAGHHDGVSLSIYLHTHAQISNQIDQ